MRRRGCVRRLPSTAGLELDVGYQGAIGVDVVALERARMTYLSCEVTVEFNTFASAATALRTRVWHCARLWDIDVVEHICPTAYSREV